jgi:hypothetical protein
MNVVWENDCWALFKYTNGKFIDIDIYSKSKDRFMAIYSRDGILLDYCGFFELTESKLPKYIIRKAIHYHKIRKVLP